jgi:hypothetical protein
MHDPYQIVSVSIVVLGHALTAAGPVLKTVGGSVVPRVRLDVMQELYFLLTQLVRAPVKRQSRDAQWK